jgi:hypothetical protein
MADRLSGAVSIFSYSGFCLPISRQNNIQQNNFWQNDT